MSLIRLRMADAEVLERLGKRSAQIVSRHNAPTAHITITRVVMQPGATSPRHQHHGAEQTWIVEQGRGGCSPQAAPPSGWSPATSS